ncbi:MAG: BamA/TamA family outer membrane protein [Elusimicrobia bacterium]|nr:BamA/TamA family outer membrane protein [Elusimicrobiota bacterium]
MLAALISLLLAVPSFAQTKAKAKKPRPVRPAKVERPHSDRPPTSDYDVAPPTAVPRAITEERPAQPWPVRLMVHNINKGMFIGLPIIDTDPNRGVTMGVMPIWVVKKDNSDRIQQIWAPSLTYNKTFKATPTFRFYTYPTRESNLTLRGSISQVTDRELMGEWHDRDFQGSGWETGLRVQYNVDGSRRFFGVGPASTTGDESNYKEDFMLLRSLIGAPLGGKDSNWMAKLSHSLLGMKVANGPISAIPAIDKRFPGAAPEKHHQNSNVKLGVDYDSRDHDVTTSEGTYGGFFFESSQKPIGSEYGYQQYAVDFRHWRPWNTERKHVSTGMLRFTQIQGYAPFWLMPQLGGKYIHRAYGEGRFIDRGIVSLQLEHRYTFASVKTAGVSTDFELAPFTGVGTVFNEPGVANSKYLRPLVGGAIRAVARPQVVGSIDFGVGQEGMTAFMDINYSW